MADIGKLITKAETNDDAKRIVVVCGTRAVGGDSTIAEVDA